MWLVTPTPAGAPVAGVESPVTLLEILLGPEVIKSLISRNVCLISVLSLAHILKIVCFVYDLLVPFLFIFCTPAPIKIFIPFLLMVGLDLWSCDDDPINGGDDADDGGGDGGDGDSVGSDGDGACGDGGSGWLVLVSGDDWCCGCDGDGCVDSDDDDAEGDSDNGGGVGRLVLVGGDDSGCGCDGDGDDDSDGDSGGVDDDDDSGCSAIGGDCGCNGG